MERKNAQKLLGRIAAGLDPVAESTLIKCVKSRSNYLYELLLSRSQKRFNEYVFLDTGAVDKVNAP